MPEPGAPYPIRKSLPTHQLTQLDAHELNSRTHSHAHLTGTSQTSAQALNHLTSLPRPQDPYPATNSDLKSFWRPVSSS